MNTSKLFSKIFKKQQPLDYIIYLSIITVGIFLDQLTKYLVSAFMEIGQSIPLIKNFLNITYIANDGAAFGSMDGEIGRFIFMTMSTVMIVALSLYLFLGHAENRLYGISTAMIISGGIGNMIDRLGFGFYVNSDTGIGEVIDFIDFCGIWNYIFNGADSFVCVGAGLLILALILDIIKESKQAKAGNGK